MIDFSVERVPGMVPDFGAIFMSNNETKMECFRREVFALPSSQASFVKQVKVGMVLFLFEFKTRQLHGVFQACSDGAMNIVPNAFSSSGKQFPAQVKFTTIWKCDPLSEYEFRDAIKDNYFSANKFNFGLSEDQVHRLLLLFSRRKLKQPLPPRRLARSMVTKQPGIALRKVRRVVYNGKHVMSDNVGIKTGIDMENDLEPVISTEYSRYSTDNGRRVTDNDSFLARYRVGNNEHLLENDPEPSILTDFSGHAMVKENVLPEDGRLASSYEMGKNWYTGDDFNPVISREHSGNCFGEVSRVADEDGFLETYKGDTNCNLDNGEYLGNYSDEVRRVAEDGKCTISDRFENEYNLDNGQNSDILSRYSTNSLGKVKRVSDDGNYRTTDRLENKRGLDSGLGPVISTEYSSLYQSSLIPKVYSSNRSVDNNYSLVQDQVMPSAFSRSMEPWISKLSYPSFPGDANISSPIPYDPDAPSFQYGSSSSIGVNRSSDSVNECAPPDINASRDICPFLKNQSFQLLMQPKASSKHPYDASGVDNYVPFSAPNNCKCTYCVAGIPPRARYSVNKAVNPADCEKSSLSPMLVGRRGNHGLKDRGPSLSLSPSKNPLFESDVGYSVVSEEKYKHKTPWLDNNETFTTNVRLRNRSQQHMHSGVGSLESMKANCNETHGFKYNVESPRALKGVGFDIRKKRNSVFSRLSVAPEVDEQEQDIHMGYNEDDTDISVDEIMGMLHQGHNCWLKMPRKSAVSFRQSDDDKNSRDKWRPTFFYQKFRNDSILVPKMMNMNHTSANEENLDSIDQCRPIVDFKRRSQVQKKVEQTRSRGSVGNVESEASLINQPKRRKLARPEFCNTVSSNDKGNGDSLASLHESSQDVSVMKDNTDKGEAQDSLSNHPRRRKLVRPDFRIYELSNDNSNGDSSTSLLGSSPEIAVIKDHPDNSEALLISQAYVHNFSQCAELPHAIDQTGSGGNNFDSNGDPKCEAERETESREEEAFIGGGDIDKNEGLKCESERKPESCEESYISGLEDGQDLSHIDVLKNLPFSVSCEVKSHNAVEGFSGEDIVVNSLLQDHTCSSDGQKSSFQIHKGDAISGITLVAAETGGIFNF